MKDGDLSVLSDVPQSPCRVQGPFMASIARASSRTACEVARRAPIKRTIPLALVVVLGFSASVLSQPVSPPPTLQSEAEVSVIPPTFSAIRFPWRTLWPKSCGAGGPTKRPGCRDDWPVQIYFEDEAINLQLLDGGHETGRGVRIPYDDIKAVERRGWELVAITRIDGQMEYLYASRPGNHRLGHSAESKQLVEEIRRRMRPRGP
jgi:hypothetical protein